MDNSRKSNKRRQPFSHPVERAAKIKPLSCFYCNNAQIIPGVNGSYLQPLVQPYTECTCPDVPVELYDIHEQTASRRFLHSLSVSVENWMPYRCGHFSARIIRVKCSYGPCTKTIDAPEWLAAKTMYIKNTFALCCSNLCTQSLIQILERASRK